jgi:hypothetical protein
MSNDRTTTDFAAAVRASAPGRDEQPAPDNRSNAEFAQAIRATAPGRAEQR